MSFKLVFDVETTGLNPYKGDRPFAFAFMAMDGEQLYYRFEVDPMTRKVLYEDKPKEYAALKALFTSPNLEIIGHNIEFDLTMIEFAGMSFKGKFWDTKILAHVANPGRLSYKLKPLCKSMFNYPDDDMTDLKNSVKKARRQGKKMGWKLAEDVEADYAYGDPELCKKYALGDVERTLKLYKAYEGLLTEEQPPYSPYKAYRTIVDMEHSLLPIVRRMSRKGAQVDLGKVAELDTYYRACIEKCNVEKAALGYADLNPESSQQVSEVFYDQLGMKAELRKRKAKDGTKSMTKSADKKALDKWSKTQPLAKVLVELSEAQHQLNSFIIPFKENSVFESGHTLHPSFNTCGPVTGRFSCSNPNLQNITSSTSPGRKSDIEFRARECFVPREGFVWLLDDYSQVEIWVAAFLSKDSLMCKTLLEGKSVHDLTCDRVFGHKPDFVTNRGMYRKFAKIVNFSMLYGSGPQALSDLLGISVADAREYWKGFWETYPGMASYNERLKRAVKSDGYVMDVFGRPYFVEAKFAYKALNYMVQGTAAGILKRAMLSAQAFVAKACPRAELLLTIHDELVIEVPLEALTEDLVRGIESAMAGDFHMLLGMPEPFKVETSVVYKNWGMKEKWEHKMQEAA